MVRTLRVIQALVDLGDGIGVALVPYYRQLLPVMNIFIEDKGACRVRAPGAAHMRWRVALAQPRHLAVHLGDGIDYSQRFGHIGELIEETLQKLEKRGGPDAYINIKYLIPSWSPVT